MKSVTQSLLGVSAFLSMPSSIEEFNTLAGSDCVLDYANSEAYYRGVAPKVRAKFLDSIKSQLGLEPRVTGSKIVGTGENEKTVNTYEKDTSFLKFVRSQGHGDDVLQPMLQAAFDAVGWDLSSTRGSGATKKDVETAQFTIDAVNAGKSTWDRVVTNYETANPGLVIARGDDGAVSLENMALAVRANRIRVESMSMI